MRNIDKRKLVSRVFVIAVALAMVIPVSIVLSTKGPTVTNTWDTKIVKVMINDPDELQAMRSQNIEIVEDYGGFVLAKVNAVQKRFLANKNMESMSTEDFNDIYLQYASFDTRRGEPLIPANLKIDSYPPLYNKGAYIVQFRGPVKQEWKNELRNAGASIVDYVPNNAFFVRASEDAKAKISNLPFVQWVGIYHPAYKISPMFNDITGVKNINILTYQDDLEKTLVYLMQDMGDYGGGRIQYSGNMGPYGLISVEIDTDMIQVIANYLGVYWMEPDLEMVTMTKYVPSIVQSGTATIQPTGATIWDQGLHGEGEIVGALDSGIDYSHRAYSNSSSKVGTPGPDHRKIYAYHCRLDASDGPFWNSDSAAVGHGTSVITHMMGDAETTGAGSGSDERGEAYQGVVGETTNNCRISFVDTSSHTGPRPGGGTTDILDGLWDNKTSDLSILFDYIYDDGGRICTNSWGAGPTTPDPYTGGRYSIDCWQIDNYSWNHKDFVTTFSAGNDRAAFILQQASPGVVGAPSTAKNTICVGGTRDYTALEDMYDMYFPSDQTGSSRGPCRDGRLKPDVITPAMGYSTSYPGIESPDAWDGPYDPEDTPHSGTSGRTAGSTGTSYSSQSVGGLLALVRQYFREGFYPTGAKISSNELIPSGALMKAMMLNCGTEITGLHCHETPYTNVTGTDLYYPTNDQGWGRTELDKTLYFDGGGRKLFVVDYDQGVVTGDTIEFKVYVTSSSIPLNVTLVWFEPPAALILDKQMMNDLNLNVTANDGTYYKGNIYVPTSVTPNSGSQSNTNKPYDDINTQETALIRNPSTGEYTIRIIADNIAEGPQPFALVVTGAIDTGYGSIWVDRPIYSESDTINIRVEDVGASSVSVDVTSDTEITPESVTLIETPASSGIWKGSISTSFDNVSTDGKLQVSDRDTITVKYQDTSPVHDAITTATVDATKPMIRDVRATLITNSATTITWITSESANSTVYFWNATSPILVNDSAFLKTSHSMMISGLDENTDYFYDVESWDRLGHKTLDDNGGSHYRFTTTELADILVVDAGDQTWDFMQYYREDLTRTGWTFNEWYVWRDGDPPLSTLQSYKVVFWEICETYPPFSDDQRPLIQDYIDNGGRLFVSSHDLSWAFGCDDPEDDAAKSDYSTPERHNFLKYVMKEDQKDQNTNAGDPSEISHIEGLGGDPISGDYATTNRLAYTPIRSGGSGDEVEAINCAGTTTYVWKDYGIDATPDNYAIKWQSDGNNGTSGQGVWGGTPSRLVVFNFELFRIHAEVLNDPQRQDIMNKTLYLLTEDHYHPNVEVTAPGSTPGEEYTGSSITITWTRNTYSGTSVDNQTIYYSPDEGQSWTLLAYPSTSATSYVWDITGVHNEGQYLVKVLVRDSGKSGVKLSSNDASDYVFNIKRSGGDTTGPMVWAGSVTVQPNPIYDTNTTWFNATIDDFTKGNSSIHSTTPAEFFIDSIPVDHNGTGTSMNLVSSPTSPTEDVAWNGTPTWGEGAHTVYVHGQDEHGNWGTSFESSEYTQIGGGKQIVKIDLVAGLNLISMPLDVDDPDAAPFDAQDLIDLINGDGGGAVSVSRWLAATGVWDTFNDLGASPFEIKTWEGYFINCNIASTWNATGQLEGSQPVDLVAGLTLIGISKDMGASYNAQDLINDINADGGSAQAISRWLAATGVWDTFNDLGASPFIIERGAGYFVNNAVASTWTP